MRDNCVKRLLFKDLLGYLLHDLLGLFVEFLLVLAGSRHAARGLADVEVENHLFFGLRFVLADPRLGFVFDFLNLQRV